MHFRKYRFCFAKLLVREQLNKNIKIYIIEHDTRDDGAGRLNAKTYATKKEAIAEIEEFTCVKYGTSSYWGAMGWVNEDEYNDEDNVITFFEKEL